MFHGKFNHLDDAKHRHAEKQQAPEDQDEGRAPAGR
jgi:hypothetical protein